jgi:hypothetical protein
VNPQNQNLLFCGTEFNLWCSLDRGGNWTKLNNNLPTVAIHEVAIHPTNGEMVVATHGRSIWACDISALRQLSAEHLKDKIALHKPVDVIRWQSDPNRGRTNRRFTGTNPAAGAQFWYSLPIKAERVSLRIEDIEGRVVRELRGAAEPGLHRAIGIQFASRPRPAARGGGGDRVAAAEVVARPLLVSPHHQQPASKRNRLTRRAGATAAGGDGCSAAVERAARRRRDDVRRQRHVKVVLVGWQGSAASDDPHRARPAASSDVVAEEIVGRRFDETKLPPTRSGPSSGRTADR